MLAIGLVFTTASCGAAVEGGRHSDESDVGQDIAALSLELTIGKYRAAERDYQFASILDLVVTPDGMIWALDGDASVGGSAQTPLLRQFDSAGTFLRRVAREGDGPGEYRAPHALALMKDGRVALRDAVLRDRITIYSTDGTLDTTWSLDRNMAWGFGAAYAIEVDTSGVVWLPTTGSVRPTRAVQQPLAFVRLRPDGSVMDTVPYPPIPRPARDTVRVTRALAGGGMATRGFMVPHQPRGLWAWSPAGHFAIAKSDIYRIELLPPPRAPAAYTRPRGAMDGGSSRIITRDVAPVPVPEAERAEARKALTDRVTAYDRAAEVRIPEIPRIKPLLRGISFSADGQLLAMVSMTSQRRDSVLAEPTAYDVFDQGGNFRGRLIMPESFSLAWVSGDRIWGVYADSLGTQTVRRYKVRWGQADTLEAP
jgi:hypothetical protein